MNLCRSRNLLSKKLIVITNKAWHEKMVSLVKLMLELYKSSPRMPQEKEMLKREIAATDRQIDALVYALPPSGMIYGRKEEEIKIVEKRD